MAELSQMQLACLTEHQVLFWWLCYLGATPGGAQGCSWLWLQDHVGDGAARTRVTALLPRVLSNAPPNRCSLLNYSGVTPGLRLLSIWGLRAQLCSKPRAPTAQRPLLPSRPGRREGAKETTGAGGGRWKVEAERPGGGEGAERSHREERVSPARRREQRGAEHLRETKWLQTPRGAAQWPGDSGTGTVTGNDAELRPLAQTPTPLLCPLQRGAPPSPLRSVSFLNKITQDDWSEGQRPNMKDS